jgi:hypothetical protein
VREAASELGFAFISADDRGLADIPRESFPQPCGHDATKVWNVHAGCWGGLDVRCFEFRVEVAPDGRERVYP